MTKLADNVKKGLRRTHPKELQLSGTPFNLFDQYDSEDQVFTWDYVMEQKAKQQWEIDYPDRPNPYESLPSVSMFTFDVGQKFRYQDETKAFNFKEFFRVVDETGEFAYKADVVRFLDYITQENTATVFPFSTAEFRQALRHTLWLLPGVKEAGALAKLLKAHAIFKEYKVVNVVEDGDSEGATQSDLDKVKQAIGNDPSQTKTITLTVRKLTTGVNIPEWTGVVFLSNTESPTSYLQAAFRAQTPFSHEKLGMKTTCYVFDFAPDRALKVMSQSIGLSTGQGKLNTQDQKDRLARMLNFLPILGQDGNQMKTFNVDRMMTHLKRAYAEKAVNSGFSDSSLYNDKLLLNMSDAQIALLNDVKKIVANSGAKADLRNKNLIIADNGLDQESYEKAVRLDQTSGRDLSDEEKAAQKIAKKKLKAAQQQRQNVIKVLRAISVRIPMMIYGMDKDIDEDITIQDFIDAVDEVSWAEFMPQGLTKSKFKELADFYDEAIFVAAGRRIRELAKQYDRLDILDRTERIGDLFASFKNPDKETVLTPWRVVNQQCCETFGGYTNFDPSYHYTTEEGKAIHDFRETAVTNEVYQAGSRFLDPNSKTGLYPLFVATSLYYKRQEQLAQETAGKFDIRDLDEIWQSILKHNIYVIAKTPMAKRITERTLSGFKGYASNVHYEPDLVAQLRAKDGITRVAQAIQEVFGKVKFDVVVGNPPYQENDNGARDDGSSNASASPLYNKFLDLAKALEPRFISLIMPARWVSGAGKGLDSFSQDMLNDTHIKQFSLWVNGKDVFPNTEIKGGISTFLRDQEYQGEADIVVYADGEHHNSRRYLNTEGTGIFVRYAELANILHKVKLIEDLDNSNMQKIVSVLKPYGFRTDFFKNPAKYGLPEVFADRQAPDDLAIYGLLDSKRIVRYAPRSYPVPAGADSIDKYKVFIPKAYGGAGAIGETIPTPILGLPIQICTETYLRIGAFDSQAEAEHLLSYIRTKFFRVMVGILKITQDAPNRVYGLVPLQDFSSESDIDWSQPISSIDQQLYAKYGLSQDEIAFIEEKVKEMV